MKCPCGLKENYDICCGLFIDSQHTPKTAQELMRSRFSAYALNNIDYIIKTMRGKPLQGFSKKSVQEWNQSIKWLTLTIIHAEKTCVEFKATYINESGQVEDLHEKSLFKQKNDQLFYIGTI